jgi:hypothetical protein
MRPNGEVRSERPLLRLKRLLKKRPKMTMVLRMTIFTGKFNQEPNYFKKFEFSRQKWCAFFTL